jgi:hypothetical protein
MEGGRRRHANRKKEKKGKGKGNWTPMWINMATPLH